MFKVLTTRFLHFVLACIFEGDLAESVQIEDLYAKAVEVETSSSINGYFYFGSNVTFEGDINITGTLNISHMPKFEQNVQNLLTDVEPGLFGAAIAARNSCFALMQFYETMKSQFSNFLKTVLFISIFILHFRIRKRATVF